MRALYVLKGFSPFLLRSFGDNLHNLDGSIRQYFIALTSYFDLVRIAAVYVICGTLASKIYDHYNDNFHMPIYIYAVGLIAPVSAAILLAILVRQIEQGGVNIASWKIIQICHAVLTILSANFAFLWFIFQASDDAKAYFLTAWLSAMPINLAVLIFNRGHFLFVFVFGVSMSLIFYNTTLSIENVAFQNDDLVWLTIHSMTVTTFILLALRKQSFRFNTTVERYFKANSELAQQQMVLKDERDISRNIQNSLDEGVLVLDETLKPVQANESFQRHFPHILDEERLGSKVWLDFVEIIMQHLGGRGEESFEALGEFSIAGVRVPHGNEKPYFVFTFLDVSAKNQRVRESIFTQKMSSLGTLAAGVAHDFNNHLAVIVANLEILSDPSLDQNQRAEIVGSVLQSCENAKVVTRQLLSVAQHLPEKSSYVSVRSALERVKTLAELASASSRNYVCDVQTDAHVLADASLLETMLFNLLNNAKDATTRGSTISLSALEKDNKVFITVSDTGAGMDERTLKRATEPFFSTKAASGGNGLGLSAVKDFVHNIGGQLSIQSAVNQGTTVTIELKAYAKPKVRKENEALAGLPESRTSLGKVLLVDDNVHLLQALGDNLRRRGCKVVSCESLDEVKALDHEVLLSLDLVLCDVQMPNGNGIDVSNYVLSIASEIKFVFMTGNIISDLNENASILEELSSRECLYKPIHVADVLKYLS